MNIIEVIFIVVAVSLMIGFVGANLFFGAYIVKDFLKFIKQDENK